MSGSLDTGIKLVKNVGSLNYGAGSLRDLPAQVDKRRARAIEAGGNGNVVYAIDEFFADRPDILARLGARPEDRIEFVPTRDEPNTQAIDQRVAG